MNISALCLLFVALGTSWIAAELSENPVVLTEYGPVRGLRMKSTGGRDFFSFRGIPYAKPPVGNLRFKEPEDPDPWTEEFDATRPGPTCIQFDAMLSERTIGVEDCLTLNVYTPRLNVAQGMLPVMVFIHGGGFVFGSGNAESPGFYGPLHFLDRDVILVTLNYRVEIMGFLSTEDSEAPGNYGLLDQSLAIKWVQNNILRFGGNPYSVTIFGESAGGASVNYHLLSPYSKGLFQRAIIQSGSAKCPWAIHHDVGKYTNQVAETLGCPTSSSRALVDCLRSKTAEELVNTRKNRIYKWGFMMNPVAFGPRIDAERASPFLSADPHTLISRRKFNSVPILTGANANEGAYILSGMFSKNTEKVFEEFKENPIQCMLEVTDLLSLPNGKEIGQKAYKKYVQPEIPLENQLENLENIISDFMFNKWIHEDALLYSKYGDHPTFFYRYAHHGQYSLLDITGRAEKFGAYFNTTVSHADELLLLFSNSYFQLTSPNDIKVKNRLLDYWTTFAATGYPQSKSVTDNWKPLKGNQFRYLQIESENTHMINDELPFQSRLTFWNEFFPSPVVVERDEL